MEEKKIKKLSKLLWNQPFGETEIPNEQEMSIKSIISLAEDEDCIDEIIEIFEANPEIDLRLVDALLYAKGLYPPLEIVDDDELDEEE